MTTTEQTYINALLADAAYVSDLVGGGASDKLTFALSPRLTPTLAEFIGDNFEVAAHKETNDNFGGSGKDDLYGDYYLEGGGGVGERQSTSPAANDDTSYSRAAA